MHLIFVVNIFLGCDSQREKDINNLPKPKDTTEKTVYNAEIKKSYQKYGTSHDDLLNDLGSSERSKDAIAKLVKIGKPALPSLQILINTSQDMTAKGWGIQAISQMPISEASILLTDIEKSDQETLVKTWAAAAIINRTTSKQELLDLVSYVSTYPALKRPFGLQLERLSGDLNALQMLELIQKMPTLQETFAPLILKSEPKLLIDVMLTHADMTLRRQSAGYLASMGRSNRNTIPQLLKAYDFTPSAREVMWKGGPLYVPSINWDKENGVALFAHLLSWHIFCEKQNLRDQQNQLYNNMRSVTLLQSIGMPRYVRNSTAEIIKAFAPVYGSRNMQVLLEEQKVYKQYAHLIGQ